MKKLCIAFNFVCCCAYANPSPDAINHYVSTALYVIELHASQEIEYAITPEEILYKLHVYKNSDNERIKKYVQKFHDDKKSSRYYMLPAADVYFESRQTINNCIDPKIGYTKKFLRQAHKQLKKMSPEAIDRLADHEIFKLTVSIEQFDKDLQALDNIMNLVEVLKFKDTQITK